MKCQLCGKKATINVQECIITWTIDDDEKYTEKDINNFGDNDFYCNECYAKQLPTIDEI